MATRRSHSSGCPRSKGSSSSFGSNPVPTEKTSEASDQLAQVNDNAGIPGPSAWVRCGGCVIEDSSPHVLYFVVELSSSDPSVTGIYDLELVLEGPAWGGPAAGCNEGLQCWYEAQIADRGPAPVTELQAEHDGLLAERDEAQAERDRQLSFASRSWRSRRAAAESDVDALDTELATSPPAGRRSPLAVPRTRTGWFPLYFAVLVLAIGGLWLALGRRAASATSATTTPAPNAAVVGTIGPWAEGGSGERPPDGDVLLGVTTGVAEPPPGAEGSHQSTAGLPLPPPPPQARSAPPLEGPAPPLEGPAPPPSGWYADPDDPDLVRWWDGAGWTGHTERKP